MLRYALILILSLASSVAFAADSSDKRSSEAKASETERNFTVPVPQSEIKLEPLRFVEPKPTEFAFGISSWVPENFTRGTYTGGSSQFQKGDIPDLSITRIQPFATWQSGFNLSSKMGLAYSDLERTTGRTVGTASVGNSTENLNMYMARIGVEASWANLLPWGLEPNLGFAILPTWMSAENSQFEDNVGVFGVGYEGTAGILWRAPHGSGHFGNFSFGVSGQEVSGNIGGSSLTGFGILGEMRVTL